MPKLKTNRGAAKRFSKTASGKFRKKQSHARHILTKKDSKRKRNLRAPDLINRNDEAVLRKLLPYA